MDLDRALNAEQRAAVLAPDGPALVIAAAGTGKTRTLTWRVAHLVDRGVPPRRILLLTFTNRAAREMLDRARVLVGESVGGIWGGTFHHLANRILRRHAQRIGYGNGYTILDQDDARKLVRGCTRDLGLADKHFPKPEILLSALGLARSRESSPVDVLEARLLGTDAEPADALRVLDAYAARKRALDAMDFDDLLAGALRLLREHPDVGDRYREQFLHVLVDEYQDTNAVQAALVDELAARHRNLFVVGDDFQSIYAWRGADFRQFLTFPKRYADTREFKLETNYRSVPGVLSLANACIAANPEQFQKTLRPVRGDGARPILAELRDGEQQARYVIEQIATLRGEGVPLREMAVLYRAHFHALELQMLLGRERLPFTITSGVRFYEQAHVKDVLALLRLVQNPGDELSFTRLLCLLPRVGERTALRIWKALGGRFAPLHPAAWTELIERLPAAAKGDGAAMAGVFPEAETKHLAREPGLIVERFLAGFYRAYALVAFDTGRERVEDLQGMSGYLAGFRSLADFLNEVALQTNLDDRQRAEDAGEGLTLSTVHQAKGLEWRAVFVLWLNDSLFPSGRALSEGGDEAEAEERRLFYVAVTRARDWLFLCCPRARIGRDGSYVPHTPSRFLRETPPALVRRARVGYGP